MLLASSLLGKGMDKKIGFFGRFIAEKSVFGRHREEKTEEKSIRGKIGGKSVKSPIFRRKIGNYRFFHRKNRACASRAEDARHLHKNRR